MSPNIYSCNNCKFQWFWSNHCKFPMVFEETITIECFFGGLTIAINALQWFFRWFFILLLSLSMVFNGLGPLVKRWIVVVYHGMSLCVQPVQDMYQRMATILRKLWMTFFKETGDWMLNCKINGTVHILFLKSHIWAPGDQNSLIFFPPVDVYPIYLHVIIDFGHIWGPFMVKFEKMLFWLSTILGKIPK